MTKFQTQKNTNGLRGEIRPASDKSLSHRALMFSALATGRSRIRKLLMGEDVMSTLNILRALGVRTVQDATTGNTQDEIWVEGKGLHGFSDPKLVLNCGNSGTTMRLMLGILSGANINAGLTGDDSLNKRPMERVFKPLKEMGAEFAIETPLHRRLIRTLRHAPLVGISYDSPVASAQVKSAILLAGLYAEGETCVSEPALSRNHTELMLKGMGADISTQGTFVHMRPAQFLHPLDVEIPADISSAAFFLVAGCLVKNSEIAIRDVNLNPTRTGILDALLAMGADIKIENQREVAGEAVGDLVVKSSHLKGIKISGALIPRLIDEIPILALAAAFADGETTVSDAAELRVKESDRIKTVCAALKNFGVAIEEKPDGFVVSGGSALKANVLELHSHLDHRLAMMLVVAGLVCENEFAIDDVSPIATSFPNFFEALKNLGM